MAFNFATPARLNLTFNCTTERHPGNVVSYGQMHLISPEEPLHAMLFAIARDIREGKEVEVLEMWRTMVLSCVGTLIAVAPDVAFWKASQHRENVGAEYEAVYFSTVSRLQLEVGIIFPPWLSKNNKEYSFFLHT